MPTGSCCLPSGRAPRGQKQACLPCLTSVCHASSNHPCGKPIDRSTILPDISNLLFMDQIDFSDFLKVDIRCGTVKNAEPFPEARKPAIKLWVDFGPGIGERKSSAQITDLYAPADLVGRKVLAVVNFPPRQIGPFMSEVLVLGFPDTEGRIVLVEPDESLPDGARLA